jgi:PadR family transcriptional regulator, regulatory protein PadR
MSEKIVGVRRVTPQLLLILGHLLRQPPGQGTYGFQVMAATGLRSGTVYPTLRRLAADGWVAQQVVGWPPRVECHLTEAGRARARALTGKD